MKAIRTTIIKYIVMTTLSLQYNMYIHIVQYIYLKDGLAHIRLAIWQQTQHLVWRIGQG